MHRSVFLTMIGQFWFQVSKTPSPGVIERYLSQTIIITC